MTRDAGESRADTDMPQTRHRRHDAPLSRWGQRRHRGCRRRLPRVARFGQRAICEHAHLWEFGPGTYGGGQWYYVGPRKAVTDA